MKKSPGLLNRTLLTLFGLLLILLGAACLALAAGFLSGIGEGWESSSRPFAGIGDALAQSWLAAVVIAVALVLFVLALWWMMRQVPQSGRASVFRFQEDTSEGVTVASADVIADAVAAHVEDLPHVTRAQVRLRGSRSEAKLLINLTVNERANLGDVTDQISHEVLPAAAEVLGYPLADVSYIVNVTSQPRSRDHVEIA